VGELVPGFIVFVLITSAVLTLPTAVALLWFYRRSVRREMTTGATDFEPLLLPQKAATARPPLRIIDSAGDLVTYSEHSLRTVVSIYGAAGLAFALLMATGSAIQARDDTWSWLSFLMRMLTLTAENFWPAVLAIELIAATSRRERLGVALGYFIAFAMIGAGAVAVGSKLTARQLATSWLIHNALPTLLILMFLVRRIRAVGPLVLAFTLIAVSGAWFAVSVLPGDSDAVFYSTLAGSFVGFGFLGWLLFRRLGVLYQRKRFSDQSLMLDLLFLYFAITQALIMDPSIGRYVWFGPAAILAYKTIALAGFGYVRRRNSGAPVRMLLLLRVFNLGGRSERMFDALAKRWRRLGSICLIAGPDLLTAAVEPHEFLDFIGGNLSRRFVTDKEDLSKRIGSLDTSSGP
jgi:hypothetical protein